MADEEAKVTKPTRYYILRRNRTTGVIVVAGEREARGAEKAISDYLDHDDTSPLGHDGSVVAVPVSNWTERGANVRTTRVVDLVELEPLAMVLPGTAPVEDDGA